MAENNPDPEERNLLFIDLNKAIDRRAARKQAAAEEFDQRSLQLQAERGISKPEADLEVLREWDAEKKRLYGEPELDHHQPWAW
jgi:hypothetical protein